MSQAVFGVVFILFIIVCVFTIYVRLGPYRREHRKAGRYKLFAARDRLVWLVASGALSEDDRAFRFLYEGVNRLIPAAKPLSLRAAVTMLKHSQLVDQEQVGLIRCMAEHKDKEVRETVAELFDAIIDIFLVRSLFVQIVRLGFQGHRVARWVRRALGSIFPAQKEAYEIYQRVNPVVHRLQAA